MMEILQLVSAWGDGLATVSGHVVAAGGDSEGLLNWVDMKSDEAKNVARTVAVLLAIVFFMWNVIAARGALARMIMAGLAAGLFIWIVFNVTELRDRVDDEVNSAPVASATVAASDGPDSGADR